MLDVRVNKGQKSFIKQFPIVKNILEKLIYEMENVMDMVPGTPLFIMAHQLMEMHVQQKIMQIRQLPVSAKTLNRRKRGGTVRVTASGGLRHIIEDSVETGVRTGWLMQTMEKLDKMGGGGEFGYLIARKGIGASHSSASVSSFIVQLNAEMFWKAYPREFNEWLMGKMGGLGLLDLPDESMNAILDSMSRVMLKRIDLILRGKK